MALTDYPGDRFRQLKEVRRFMKEDRKDLAKMVELNPSIDLRESLRYFDISLIRLKKYIKENEDD